MATAAAERRRPLDWMWDEVDMAAPSGAAQTAPQRRANAAPTRSTVNGLAYAYRRFSNQWWAYGSSSNGSTSRYPWAR
jgi:hypothetical protein